MSDSGSRRKRHSRHPVRSKYSEAGNAFESGALRPIETSSLVRTAKLRQIAFNHPNLQCFLGPEFLDHTGFLTLPGA